MSWNYENYLKRELTVIARDYNVNIEICEEQMFAKIKDPIPNTIYVVIKYLATSIAYNSTVRPIQVLVVSEGNNIENSRMILESFAHTHNWISVVDGTTHIKQQYSSPVVLSNFNDIGYDFRSVLYFTGTLIEMTNIVDLYVEVNDVLYKNAISIKVGDNATEVIYPITFQLQYNVGGDTQPVGGEKISKTIKSISTLSLTFVIPAKSGTFLTECIGISSGTNSGNTSFKVEFTLNEVDFSYDMILTSFNFTTAPENVPAISIGLMR